MTVSIEKIIDFELFNKLKYILVLRVAIPKYLNFLKREYLYDLFASNRENNIF